MAIASGRAIQERLNFFETNPALLRPEFFPDPDTLPELAHLYGEHERLLGILREAAEAAATVRRRHETEDANRADTLRASFLSGDESDDEAPDQEQRAAEVNEARVRQEAATAALAEFLDGALAEVADKAGQLYDRIEQATGEAEQKRTEAARLLAEAERAGAEVARQGAWLDRISGRSVRGYFPYGALATPAEVRHAA